MLWHIELKFCIWLCFTVLQIKFECRQFASIFVGVMPLLELRILEIHSFPHFSLTPFNILSWKFAYYFFFLYYRSSLSVVNLRLFWSYASFRTYTLSGWCLAYLRLSQTQTLTVTISTTAWNKQDKRALARCGMRMSISADGEKKGDSSAPFDVRPDLFVW